MKPSQTCFNLIQSFEGYERKVAGSTDCTAYLCPAKIWTIGFGTTYNHDAKRAVRQGDRISRETAERYMRKDIEDFALSLNEEIVKAKCVVTQNQFDALVSFVYNIGIAAFRSSSVFTELKSGNNALAADRMLRWTKAGKIELEGLVRRRKEERALFLRKESE